MSLAAHNDADRVGPLPAPGHAAWIEGIPAGPLEVMVEQVDAVIVRTDLPRVGGVVIPLRVGTRVELHYNAAAVPCVARARVVGTPPGRPDGLWMVVGSVERMQRREAVRVPLAVMAHLRCDEPPVDEVGATEDISSTGVLLRTTRAIDARGVTMSLTIHLGEGEDDLVCDVEVARVLRSPQGGTLPWKIGMCFTGLDRAMEERLTRMVFDRQRELRKRATGRE